MSETPPVESISPPDPNVYFLAGYFAATPKWVNVKDHLPSTYSQYLVHVTNGQIKYMEALYWNPYQAAWSGLIYGNTVTHWMELPEGPVDDSVDSR